MFDLDINTNCRHLCDRFRARQRYGCYVLYKIADNDFLIAY